MGTKMTSSTSALRRNSMPGAVSTSHSSRLTRDATLMQIRYWRNFTESIQIDSLEGRIKILQEDNRRLNSLVKDKINENEQ
jgi:hypothetical protein